ncbi:hypothetical protein [Xanthomonas phaseoli]|uniref:hypothetical protein n=1 Tax=Xanthomonas phaseoli TaxID=1985254 RepID=UPI003CCF09FD
MLLGRRGALAIGCIQHRDHLRGQRAQRAVFVEEPAAATIPPGKRRKRRIEPGTGQLLQCVQPQARGPRRKHHVRRLRVHARNQLAPALYRDLLRLQQAEATDALAHPLQQARAPPLHQRRAFLRIGKAGFGHLRRRTRLTRVRDRGAARAEPLRVIAYHRTGTAHFVQAHIDQQLDARVARRLRCLVQALRLRLRTGRRLDQTSFGIALEGCGHHHVIAAGLTRRHAAPLQPGGVLQCFIENTDAHGAPSTNNGAQGRRYERSRRMLAVYQWCKPLLATRRAITYPYRTLPY